MGAKLPGLQGKRGGTMRDEKNGGALQGRVHGNFQGVSKRKLH
jgi:hypothetical protein